MNKEDLFVALNDIDDEFLLQSEKSVDQPFSMPFKIGVSVGITLLACMILVVGLKPARPQLPLNPPGDNDIAVRPDPQPSPNEDPIVIDPIQPEGNPNFEGGGMGFEGYTIHDISELLPTNSWNESMIYETLPVYQNDVKVDYATLKNILLKTASQLNAQISEQQIEIVSDDPMFEYLSLQAEDKRYTISVSGTPKTGIDTYIQLKQAYELPQNFNNNFHASFEEKQALGQYIKNDVVKTFQLKHPYMRITGGYYNIDGQQSYELEFIEDQKGIFDSHSKKVIVYGTSNQKNTINTIRIFEEKKYQVLNEYSVISLAQAKQQLLAGRYYGSAPRPILEKDNILKVEMVYRGGAYSHVVVPYYRFIMKTDLLENNVDDAFHVGAYYVPAIDEKYLEDENFWKGEFDS